MKKQQKLKYLSYLITPLNTLILLCLLAFTPTAVYAGSELFIHGEINDDDTITLPLYEGRSNGRVVWFIVTDASDGDLAEEFGVNRAQKLENASGTAAVQTGYFDDEGVLQFSSTVDFDPERIVVSGPDGFPPLQAEPGSIGEDGYSPLVQLSDGTILNAPHVANDSGVHDSAHDLDLDEGTVRIELVDGFARDKPILYISTESSSPVGAALEASTYAPALNAAPFVGGDGTDSSRASLAAITNGQTGINNRQRQGLNSALMGEGDPLNMLAWLPNQGRYSPLWDVFLSTWAPGENPTRQEDFFEIEDLAEEGQITAPDGGAWGPSGFIVNCPIVKRVD